MSKKRHQGLFRELMLSWKYFAENFASLQFSRSSAAGKSSNISAFIVLLMAVKEMKASKVHSRKVFRKRF